MGSIILLLVFIVIIFLIATMGGMARVPKKRESSGSSVVPQVFGVSGYGLFGLFGPVAKSSIQPEYFADILKSSFEEWGPLSEIEIIIFAQSLATSGRLRECRALGAVTAFVGYVNEVESVSSGEPYLLRVDQKGYSELLSNSTRSTPRFSVRAAARFSNEDVCAIQFFVGGLEWLPLSRRSLQSYKCHEEGSDSYWVCEKIRPMLEDLSWASGSLAALLDRQKEVKELYERSASNPLLAGSYSKIFYVLNRIDQEIVRLTQIHSGISRQLSHLIDWINAPEIMKKELPDVEGLVDMGALNESKFAFEEVCELAALVLD